ncbi:hypothetical protein [Thermostichus vulcanus]|uniref:Uncharacterized protein n=1 Tax=Thermostichus vulcanus str. 'Rupite' TaxID=2813851 RepID=A0ABT0CF74_THEVL|nr:hypothetical protein [Thermostichus vulcanus]MCJ2544432.1 hypothetical protein [Thermostichus vulcanus str. 'Rupite']
MSKYKNQGYPRPTPPNPQTKQGNSPLLNPVSNQPTSTAKNASLVRPEHMSLLAHQHIQSYMQSQGSEKLTQDDLTAVLRLSQHLRVFGLLSAAGYVNQSNQQAGKVRERTVPVWTVLLGQLVSEQDKLPPRELMRIIQEKATESPTEYLALWRRALNLANHWNFWARAYQE